MPTRSPEPAPVVEAYRAKLGHGAELYLPSWFSARDGAYDLIVHFHGLGKLQEENLDRSPINAAVVTVNLGIGTDPYAHAFRDTRAFQKLLTSTEAEIEKSGRAKGATNRRIALSAWSAGFVSIARILGDPTNAARVDAVLLADGFFTSFANIKKRSINPASLKRFAVLAEAASKTEKLFAITHSAIPTLDYPSVEETVTKLLVMTANPKKTSKAVGPRDMRERYVVDRGAFHVKGYAGVTAKDHIKQILSMGETLYPYLKARWDSPEPEDATARASVATSP